MAEYTSVTIVANAAVRNHATADSVLRTLETPTDFAYNCNIHNTR